MSGAPRHPFELLFAQLNQGMSGAGSPVANFMGSQAEAAHYSGDRLVWIPAGVEYVTRPFSLPEGTSPADQAWDFEVSIDAPDLARCGELHGLLCGWLDLLQGPEQGCPPSNDATTASTTGSVDVSAWLYPSSILSGLALTFAQPYAQTVTIAAGSVANPILAARAITDACRTVGLPVLASLVRDERKRYVRLELPASPLSTVAPVLQIDAASAAAVALGLAGDAATGAAPTTPYRPGYKVGRSKPGPVGGEIDAGAWGLVVPVRLYTPIYSMIEVKAPILSVSSEVYAATDSGSDLAVSHQ